MKVLAVVNLAASANLSDVQRLLGDELRESWKLYAENIIREAYITDHPARVVFVLEAADLAAAEAQLRTLPLVSQGYFTLQLMELRTFANWARLFAART
jgi:hypothetical protein